MPKIIIHFGELSLKGGNRSHFEKKLAANLRRLLGVRGINRTHSRMVMDVESADDAFIEGLSLMPGIRNFAVADETEAGLEAIRQCAEAAVLAATDHAPGGRRFRVSARRADKSFPLTSPEINIEVGGYLKSRLGMEVNLNAPEIDVTIELTPDSAYIYTRKHNGIGGLPVGCSGKGVALLSGGIDSPVAAFTMMKRGMEVVLVHCYNSSINRDFAKIRDLAGRLASFQPRLRLYLVDLEEFQRHAIALIPAKYRMIIYKRQMIRVANEIAAREKAHAVITGDSLGQVASQTLANIRAIYDAGGPPLLSPLIGFDKEEIIALARRIGSFDISTLEYCDICSYLIAKHPETKARPESIRALEAQLPIDRIKAVIQKETISLEPLRQPAAGEPAET